MGVKTTQTLMRLEAESLYFELLEKLNPVEMSDGALEALLASMNDQVHGGEGFTNYSIVSDHESASPRPTAADAGVREALIAALKPLARLEIPTKPQGNAGAYSIRHDHIRAAEAALSLAAKREQTR
jgi:hypothetical protein